MLYFGMENWILGFVDGVSASPSAQTETRPPDKLEDTILCETNGRDVIRRIDKFCEANPATFLIQAALIVVADLHVDAAHRRERRNAYKKDGFRMTNKCWDERGD
jgi:hypothetical protein